jgi:hypothetical protein
MTDTPRTDELVRFHTATVEADWVALQKAWTLARQLERELTVCRAVTALCCEKNAPQESRPKEGEGAADTAHQPAVAALSPLTKDIIAALAPRTSDVPMREPLYTEVTQPNGQPVPAPCAISGCHYDKIEKHNAECERLCDNRKSCGYDGYAAHMSCTHCPKDWMIL